MGSVKSIPFPNSTKNHFDEKNMTVRKDKELGKYEKGQILNATNYSGTPFGFKVKITDIRKNILAKDIGTPLKDDQCGYAYDLDPNEIVDVIKFKKVGKILNKQAFIQGYTDTLIKYGFSWRQLIETPNQARTMLPQYHTGIFQSLLGTSDYNLANNMAYGFRKGKSIASTLPRDVYQNYTLPEEVYPDEIITSGKKTYVQPVTEKYLNYKRTLPGSRGTK